MDESPETKGDKEWWIYVEDALIVVAIALLFVLTVFFRNEPWGKWALTALLLVMLIVFVRRLRRAHRAFKGPRVGNDTFRGEENGGLKGRD